MTLLALTPLVQVFAERLVNTAVAGIALAGIVWIFLRVLGRQNSGVRFAVWFSTLVAIVALPFFSGLLLNGTLSRATSPVNGSGEIVLAASWATYLLIGWGAGAAFLLLRLGLGLWRMHEVRNGCRDVELSAFDPAIGEALRTFASRRRVIVCVSSEVAVPAAIGLFRPAIVFPSWLLPQLTAAEIEMILRHELAHFRRWDDWTNLAQKIAKAVLFFHPAVWWIENRLTLEREMACDDMVLAQTGSPRAYASSLISFAEKLHNARSLALAQALVSRMHQMSLRVAQILDGKHPRGARPWKPVFGMSAALLAIVLTAAPRMPRVVAFESQPSPQPQASTIQAVQSRKIEQKDGVATANRITDAALAPRTLHRASAAQAEAIPATFGTHRGTAAAMKPSLLARATHGPLIMRPIEQDVAAMPTIYILRPVEFEYARHSVPIVWTVYIWKVDGKNPAGKQLESAIVISWI